MTEFSHLAQPIRVKLDPGDMLYLPSLWYHKVSQHNDGEGICCSINYCELTAMFVSWIYDSQMNEGMIWDLKVDSIPLMHSFGKWRGRPLEQKSHDRRGACSNFLKEPGPRADSMVYRNGISPIKCPSHLAMHERYIIQNARAS